jgi:MFS family permease
MPGSESRRYLGAVLLSNFFASIAFSILSPAMVANLVQARTSALLIAVATSIWALHSAVGGPFYTRFIARYSARRWLVIGVFVYALVLLSFPFIRGIWAWIALQLVSGIALGVSASLAPRDTWPSGPSLADADWSRVCEVSGSIAADSSINSRDALPRNPRFMSLLHARI